MSSGQGGRLKRSASVSPNRSEASKKVNANSDNNNMGEPSVNKSIDAKLEVFLARMDGLSSEINGRIDKLEISLAEKITTVVQAEVGKVRQELQGQINILKQDIAGMKETVSNMGELPGDDGLSRNVVIFGIPESPSENIENKVNAVIREGVKVNVEVEKAERKKSRKEGQPGIVLAKLKNKEDKELVMKEKKKLAQSTNHKIVSIDHERSAEERRIQANMRVLSKVIGKDKLVLKGGRLIEAKKNGAR